MKRKRRSNPAPPNNGHGVAALVWNHEPYPVIDDGRMLVRVIELQGPQWV
jgi:hypothetical protein